MRDSQRSKVYSWEQSCVAPKDSNTRYNLEQATVIVNYVWQELGLKYPPKLHYLSAHSTSAGEATRLEIGLSKNGVHNWVILHELAHSLTSNFEGKSVGHNNWFVGMYMKLLNKFLGIPFDYLYETATKCGVKYNPDAYPIMDY